MVNLNEEEEGVADFKWHCRYGIIENIHTLEAEFNLYRGLKPIKIFITGPPASGKTYFGEKLA